MKKTILLIAASVLFFTCKKEKDKTPEPEPTPAPVVYTISVKVDGVEKHCNSCYSGSKSGGLRGSYFYLAGFEEQIYFSCGALPSVGSHPLVKYGNPYLMYVKNNTYYRATKGTINITKIDTSQSGVINNLEATLDFKTDTTNGTFFNISEGSINLKN